MYSHVKVDLEDRKQQHGRLSSDPLIFFQGGSPRERKPHAHTHHLHNGRIHSHRQKQNIGTAQAFCTDFFHS